MDLIFRKTTTKQLNVKEMFVLKSVAMYWPQCVTQ